MSFFQLLKKKKIDNIYGRSDHNFVFKNKYFRHKSLEMPPKGSPITTTPVKHTSRCHHSFVAFVAPRPLHYETFWANKANVTVQKMLKQN